MFCVNLTKVSFFVSYYEQISQSFCPWKAFPSHFNICMWGWSLLERMHLSRLGSWPYSPILDQGVGDKHSSLFGLILMNKEKGFNSLATGKIRWGSFDLSRRNQTAEDKFTTKGKMKDQGYCSSLGQAPGLTRKRWEGLSVSLQIFAYYACKKF